MSDLTHFGPDGRPRMVDVAGKDVTGRRAVASGRLRLSPDALALARSRDTKKGDPLAISELAGIMGAKKTADLIPLCHPLSLEGVDVGIEAEADGLRVVATVRTQGRTGVEMEALTAVATACLTLYDMLKSVDRAMVIADIRLEEKSGGASGDFRRDR